MSGFPDTLERYDWGRFEAVVFDVDGTLYDQRMLRRKVFAELVAHCFGRPTRLRDLFVIVTFRKLREIHAEREEADLEQAQYRWTAEKLDLPVEPVRRIVEEWIHRRPLRHLLSCRPPGLRELFDRLGNRNIKIGVFSDYPAASKLAALDLPCGACVSAEDAAINRFKPHPAGLLHVLSILGAAPANSLFIGDRRDRDEICAARAGCESLIISADCARRLGAAASYDLLFPGDARTLGKSSLKQAMAEKE